MMRMTTAPLAFDASDARPFPPDNKTGDTNVLAIRDNKADVEARRKARQGRGRCARDCQG